MPAPKGRAGARERELERLIRLHQGLYYSGAPEISDEAFDLLWDELKVINPEHPIFRTINSESSDGFGKEYHLIPMGSQEKAANPEAFLKWTADVGFDEFLVQHKLDGASLELQYDRGSFVRAVTRGDGRVGDDITANAKKMRGVVARLPGEWGPDGARPFSGGVRGEVLLPRAALAEFYTDKANCRNAANGIMKRKDGAGSEHLVVVCYDAAPGKPGSPFTGDFPFSDEEGKLRWLISCGFETVPTERVQGGDAVIALRARVMDERPSLPYDIDGLVVKGLEIDPDDLARSRPEKQIAFKFSLEEAITTLRSVEWSESGVTYTPIAIVDPVQLAGTTVQRANLVNPNMIASLDLRIGSRIAVTKRGEIIPKIEALVSNPPDAAPIPRPETCSACGTTLIDEGTRLACPNPTCPKIAHHRIEKWISVHDVRDFGTGLIARLFETGRVRSISDLYTLTIPELAALDRMGDTSAAKVLRSLAARREMSLSAFIAGFDIDGIGETMVEKLVSAGYATLDRLLEASAEEFASVPQFGDILAASLRSGLDGLSGEMRFLIDSNIISIRPPVEAGPLAGRSFCFTGELSSMKRPEAEALVRRLGGSVKSTVAKGLSYLVTNDPQSGSSKNAKARSLGIPIVDEAGFLALADGVSDGVGGNSDPSGNKNDEKGSSRAKTSAASPKKQMELGL